MEKTKLWVKKRSHRFKVLSRHYKIHTHKTETINQKHFTQKENIKMAMQLVELSTSRLFTKSLKKKTRFLGRKNSHVRILTTYIRIYITDF